MRLAIHLALLASDLTISLFDAATLSEEKGDASPLAVIRYERTKKGWLLLNTTFPNFLVQVDNLTMYKLVRANVEAAKEAATIKSHMVTPLLFIRALLARNAVQVAFDATAKRYRCVTTMSEGMNLYGLLGLAAGMSMSVEAKDEETAVRIAKRDVAMHMSENPEKADKLVGFFSGGCKVKQVASGAVPEYVQVSALAESPAEVALAKTPVKVAPKEKDEAAAVAAVAKA